MATVCIYCNVATQPKKRTYFKDLHEEPLLSLKELLQKHHPEDKVLDCLKEPVICCKGACQTSIRKLSRLKHELQAIESEIVGKFAVKFKDCVIDSEVVDGTPQRMGRSVIGTPERNTLNRTIAGTPCVSVNDFKLLCQGHFFI